MRRRGCVDARDFLEVLPIIDDVTSSALPKNTASFDINNVNRLIYINSSRQLVTAAQQITGHFGDNIPKRSLDWCKNLVFSTNLLTGTSQLNLTATKLQHYIKN